MAIDTNEEKLALTHLQRRGVPLPAGTTFTEAEKAHFLGFWADVSLLVIGGTKSTLLDGGAMYWGGAMSRRRGQ